LTLQNPYGEMSGPYSNVFNEGRVGVFYIHNTQVFRLLYPQVLQRTFPIEITYDFRRQSLRVTAYSWEFSRVPEGASPEEYCYYGLAGLLYVRKSSDVEISEDCECLDRQALVQ